jgi:hypothetical protein
MSKANRLRIIVGGFLGLFPAGGVTWDYLQYPLGFMQLGHDVYYIEDTCQWPVYHSSEQQDEGCIRNVRHLAKVMEAFGMKDRWAYRDAVSGETFGLSQRRVDHLLKHTDVFVNVSCASVMRDSFQQIPVRVLIDSDPMFTQIQIMKQQDLNASNSNIRQLVESHTHHFTFGENIWAADQPIRRS